MVRLEDGIFRKGSTPLLSIGIREWLQKSDVTMPVDDRPHLKQQALIDRRQEALIVVQEAQILIKRSLELTRSHGIVIDETHLDQRTLQMKCNKDILATLNACKAYLHAHNG